MTADPGGMTTLPIGREPGIKRLARTGTVDSVTGDAFVMAPESQTMGSQGQSNGVKKQQPQLREGAMLTGKQEHCE